MKTDASMTSHGEGTTELILDLVRNYQDYNASHVVTLEGSPNALDFADLVSAGQPALIRNSVSCPALHWTKQDFLDRLGGADVRLEVAVTPDGRADSVYFESNGSRVFKEPATLPMSAGELLQRTSDHRATMPSTSTSSSTSAAFTAEVPPDAVVYLQSQDNNLSKAPLSHLLCDLPPPPTFTRHAFKNQEPDATNLWIGDHRSVTSLHQDPYENIYLVLQGSKTFTLFPPTEEICLYTKDCQHAYWNYDTKQGWSTQVKNAKVPWVLVDPLQPDLEQYPLFQHARPTTVTVQAGDILYLPSMWYHHVQQHCGRWPSPTDASGQSSKEEPTAPCIAMNWWTDMDYTGEKYVMRHFLHHLVQRLGS